MAKESNKQKLLYQRNFTKFGLDINLMVSIISGLFILIFSGYALLNLEHANELFNRMYTSIINNWDWLFLLGSNFFIGVCLYLAFSKLGNVRIGGMYAKAEFTNFSWYSMLISAGMGIGLMFWAVGEPLTHSEITPFIYQSDSSISSAMAATFFHWGLHPWGIYALLGLSLAFFAYNKNLPLSLRSVFYPLLKDRIFGRTGDIIDILAVLACMFGLATSLGLGVQQINSGLNYLIQLPENVYIQVALIIVITLMAMGSILAGIHGGIRFLSVLNIRLAALFMVLVFLLGPSFYILRVFMNGLGLYLSDFLQASFSLSFNETSWQGDWTIFYLAWWISWSPFVGMFIARMSRGRTVREFILAVLIIPSLLSFLWLSVFGGTAISINQRLDGQLFETVQDNVPVALFELINQLNTPVLSGVVLTLLSIIATLLVMSYFITSSDSGSLVVEKITASGKEDTPKKQRVFWAAAEGLLAAVLLLIGGAQALDVLQTAVITTGLPFTFILIIASISVIKGIRQAAERREEYIRNKLFEDVKEQVVQGDE